MSGPTEGWSRYADAIPLLAATEPAVAAELLRDTYSDEGVYIVLDAMFRVKAERDEALAEVARLREGIEGHREAMIELATCCEECREAGKEPFVSTQDAALWRLL